MTTISALKTENRVAATIFKHKIHKKKHTEEKATEVNNRFFIFENEYPIAEQEIYNNQHPYENQRCLSNKRWPQVLIN